MDCPAAGDPASTLTRNRFDDSPYSFTNCDSDFPPCAFPFDSPRFDRNHFVSGSNTSVPTVTHTSPTGRNEKNPSSPYPACNSVSWIIRFGGVPINVIIPPMLLANASGINSLPAFIPAPAAMLTTMGSISATVPVLLTNAPMPAVASITRRNSFNSLRPASFNILPLIIFASPVWKMPPPTTNSPTIITTTEFENPASPSSGVNIWNTNNASSVHTATKSDRTFPLMKNSAESAKITNVITIISSDSYSFPNAKIRKKARSANPPPGPSLSPISPMLSFSLPTPCLPPSYSRPTP